MLGICILVTIGFWLQLDSGYNWILVTIMNNLILVTIGFWSQLDSGYKSSDVLCSCCCTDACMLHAACCMLCTVITYYVMRDVE
jgi:hypothetical protein